jgi:hypothetical protein
MSRTWAATEAFLDRFREGFRAYQSGNWPVARAVLEECCQVRTLMSARELMLILIHFSTLKSKWWG